jgi:transcriptional regulator with PAS, ATPase and Fis domain
VIDHADGRIFPSKNEFCRLALHTKEGFRRCNESVKVVRDRLRNAKKRRPVVRQCHLGFEIVSSPIHFDGKLVGFIFTGGAYKEEPTASARNELFRVIKEISTPEGSLDDHFRDIRRLSESELEHLLSLIEYGAREVMAYHGELAPDSGVASPKRPSEKFSEIIGSSPAMQTVFELLEKIVRSQSTVLIHGESGTGKELIARAIHYKGPRSKKPFVVQNCSAFNDNLLESALFGHARGAFTGAIKDQKGLCEVADGGTFFLDAIGDMSAALQVKLLRVLQEGTFTPVGATKPVHVSIRIIAASHKDLTKMVERREFREDLYYRINVLRVSLPPLRDRPEDLKVLVDHFLKKHFHGEGAPPRLAADALRALESYHWPGNIRELENEVERLIVLGADEGELGPRFLSQHVRDASKQPAAAKVAGRTAERSGTLRQVVERVEAEVIAQGLVRTHWNKSKLAKDLGISRSNLIQKVNYYGLDQKDR